MFRITVSATMVWKMVSNFCSGRKWGRENRILWSKRDNGFGKRAAHPTQFFCKCPFPGYRCIQNYVEANTNHSFYFCLYVNYSSPKQNSAHVGCKTEHISCFTVFSWASAITDISTRNAEMKSIYQTAAINKRLYKNRFAYRKTLHGSNNRTNRCAPIPRLKSSERFSSLNKKSRAREDHYKNVFRLRKIEGYIYMIKSRVTEIKYISPTPKLWMSTQTGTLTIQIVCL